jgi:hypothetical protein
MVVSKSLGAERYKMSTRTEEVAQAKSILDHQIACCNQTLEAIEASKRKGQAERLEHARRNVDCTLNLLKCCVVVMDDNQKKAVTKVMMKNVAILGESVPAPKQK